jgi:hypothetical protein
MMPSACSTLERSSAFAGAAVVGSMLLTPTALGQAAPPAHIEIHVNGAMVASFDQPPDLADDGALLYEGALDEDTAGWAVAWSFEFDPDADDDRSLAGEAEFLNTGGQSKEYRFELSVPVCPWIEHSSSIGGTAHLSLITDEDGGQLSSIGTNPVWAMTADDAVAHETFSAPFLFGGSGQGNMSTSEIFGAPFPSEPGPAVEDAMGLQLQFRLTGGERATFMSLLVLGADGNDLHECEPEPGSPDVNGDGRVNVLDLLAVLSAWGACDDCPEDITRDGVVDAFDLLQILANWG